MKEFWDQRYRDHEMVYGYEPNDFFRSFIQQIEPGRVLLPAEGEGRNAVYAAGQGWQVDAFDYSTEAKHKALAYAEEQDVHIHYYNARMEEVDLPSAKYDLIALVYAHLSSDIRQAVHRKLAESLKPGGYLIMEVFDVSQRQYDSGGPKDKDMLYTTDLLAEDFKELDIIRNEQLLTEIHEGDHHEGEAAIIRFVAQRPK
jgi:2-polyprenyl-3-methyl-5-hydroxy-6-metoxy-1,4-benzoquinol methylase